MTRSSSVPSASRLMSSRLLKRLSSVPFAELWFWRSAIRSSHSSASGVRCSPGLWRACITLLTREEEGGTLGERVRSARFFQTQRWGWRLPRHNGAAVAASDNDAGADALHGAYWNLPRAWGRSHEDLLLPLDQRNEVWLSLHSSCLVQNPWPLESVFTSLSQVLKTPNRSALNTHWIHTNPLTSFVSLDCLYVTLDYKSSHKSQFCEIEILW